MAFTPSGTYVPVSARGARIVAFGDSTVLGNDTATSHQASWPTYMQLYSKGKLYYAKNAGVIGNKTSDLIARFSTDVTPSAPTVVILGIGRNDINNSVTLATYQANIATLVGLIRGINAQPVLTTITPTNGSTRVQTQAWNQWLRMYAQANGLPIIDFYNALVDPASGNYLAAYNSGDGIHPSPAGYAVLGALVNTVISPWVTPFSPMLAFDEGDTANILGTNSLFTSTTLNANGEPTVGGWLQENAAGTTGSIVTGDANIQGNWFRNTVAGNASEVALYHPGETLTVGHKYLVSGLVEYSLSAGSTSVELDVNGAAVYPLFGVTGTLSAPGYWGISFTATQTSANIKLIIASGSTGWAQYAQIGWYDLTALGVDTLA